MDRARLPQDSVNQLLAGFRVARTCVALCFIVAPWLSATMAAAQSQWKIAGSPRMQEYCEAAFEAYRGQVPVHDISLDYRLAGTIDAIEFVRRGKADFAIIERDLTEEASWHHAQNPYGV